MSFIDRQLAFMFQNSPLRHPVFSLFYSGCVCTALGYTMQGTLAAWLMATLSTSAVMVALVQTATAGPVLVFGLIAGFVADSMDRRRMILITQWVMLTAVLALSAMESTHHLTPASAGLRQNVLGAWADDPKRVQEIEQLADRISGWPERT